MMSSTNIIKAIINMIEKRVYKMNDYSNSHNRANGMGEALEEYVKDIFANTVDEENERVRNEKIEECFSYLGNQNNPPDSIIKGGDAIEVKKIESKGSALALNSSYPKAKLFSDSKMITEACRKCEKWTEKDIIYVVGVCSKSNVVSSISMVYGCDYAASADTYERIKETISSGITAITDVDFAETNELGRVNRVDPLGITYLRIRGMWAIENPVKTFSYIYTPNNTAQFNFMALIGEDKYNLFEERVILESLLAKHSSLKITDVKIKEPNNPAKLKPAKLITFTY